MGEKGERPMQNFYLFLNWHYPDLYDFFSYLAEITDSF